MKNISPGFDPSSPGGSPIFITNARGVDAEPDDPPATPADLIRWHIDQLEDLSAELNHDHAWTPFSRRLFLTTLAESGKVSDACITTGLSRAGAYALRNRDRTFAAGWDAASAIARDLLADRLAEQALDGLTDTITRADGETVTRHHYDTRLSIAVLHRLDKRCDRAAAEIVSASGARAEWLPFLSAVGTGDEVAASAIAFPPPPPPETPSETAPHCQPCPKLGGGSMADMSPAARIALMQSIADGSLEAEHDRLALEAAAEEELAERVWVNDEGTFTNFPPPVGFDGFEQDNWGDEEYYRTLSPDEAQRYAAVQAEWAAEDEAEIAEERAEDDALRDYFFGFGDEEEEIPPSPPCGRGTLDTVEPGEGTASEANAAPPHPPAADAAPPPSRDGTGKSKPSNKDGPGSKPPA